MEINMRIKIETTENWEDLLDLLKKLKTFQEANPNIPIHVSWFKE